MIECVGCYNIEGSHFPFDMDSERRCSIDTEGQGNTQKGSYGLLIFFCPVCGKKLNNLQPILA